MSDQFDLNTIGQSVEITARIPVGVRPDGTEVGFIIFGPGSDAYKKADRAMQITNVAESLARSKTETNVPTTEEQATILVDRSTASRAVLLEHVVAGWYGFTENGVEAPYSVESLRKVLVARPGWGKKLANAVEDDLNFVGG